MNDPVNHPSHYTRFENFEAIDVCENFDFCLGNTLKYVLRCGFKGSKLEDLRKARWYLDRAIERERQRSATVSDVDMSDLR